MPDRPIELPVEEPAFRLGTHRYDTRRDAAISMVARVLGGQHPETRRIATLIVNNRDDLRVALDWLDQGTESANIVDLPNAAARR